MEGSLAPQGTLRPMFLNRSAGRRFVITSIAVVTFAGLYEVTVLDSRFAARQSEEQELSAAAGCPPAVYCDGLLPWDDHRVRGQCPAGIAAADPDLLPSAPWCGSRISRQPITASIR